MKLHRRRDTRSTLPHSSRRHRWVPNIGHQRFKKRNMWYKLLDMTVSEYKEHSRSQCWWRNSFLWDESMRMQLLPLYEHQKCDVACLPKCQQTTEHRVCGTNFSSMLLRIILTTLHGCNLNSWLEVYFTAYWKRIIVHRWDKSRIMVSLSRRSQRYKIIIIMRHKSL